MRKVKAHLHICIFPQFPTSTLPHYQVKINMRKVKAHLHISRFPNFHTSTLPASKLITHHTLQGYSKVINFMCSTFCCDDVFCALLPQLKAIRKERTHTHKRTIQAGTQTNIHLSSLRKERKKKGRRKSI